VKSEPELHAAVRDFGGRAVLHVLVIDGNKIRSDFYYLERIGCADLAYALRKVDPRYDGTDPEKTRYDVNLTLRSCECRGFLRWGKPCKHLRALAQVREDVGLPA
jgi:hypothetical protein